MLQKYEFDVVIPVHERDKPILEHCINGVEKTSSEFAELSLFPKKNILKMLNGLMRRFFHFRMTWLKVIEIIKLLAGFFSSCSKCILRS